MSTRIPARSGRTLRVLLGTLHRVILGAILGAVLGALSLAAVLALARVLARVRGTAFDLSRAPVAEVAPALRERLTRLDSDLLLTYAVSPEASMPRELRGVAEEVVGLLRSIEHAGHGRVHVQILDSVADPSLPVYLAGIGLSPFRSRTLVMDAEVESSVWSSLRIAYGAHGAASVRAVTPEILSGLQPLILAHLDLLEKPRRPRVALAAPAEYRILRRALRSATELQECDFDATALVPEDADLFFWIDPTGAEPRHVTALRAFVDRGRCAVIAGSELRPQFVGADPRKGTTPAVRLARTSFPPALLRELGLAPVEGIAVDVASKGPPLLLRSIGSDQDFRALGPQPNGTLLFAAPTAFEPDAARLSELGLTMSTLASSSTATRVRPWTEGAIPEVDLRDAGIAVRAPRLPLLALLAPDRNADPWRGSVVVAAASSPFSDEYLRQGPFAHVKLLSILVSSMASPERLAIEAAGIPGSPRVAELSPAERNLWRATVVLGVPALLAFLFLVRLRERLHRDALPGPRPARSPQRPAATAAVALALFLGLLLVARFAPGALSIDLTRDGLNGLAVETRAILARRVSKAAPVRLELVLSPEADLPPDLRPCARRLREILATFAAAAPGFEVRRVRTSSLGSADLAALARDGVLPLALAGDDAGGPPKSLFASVVLRGGGRVESLSFPDPRSFEHLEFRLAAAIERLSGARKAHVAVVASAPRLSPAEALEYQKKGLFAPGGSDVFGEARALLDEHDFAVNELDPARSELPSGTDLLLCLQPRRDAGPVLAAAARQLSRGGGVLVAGQHFTVRSRRTLDSGMTLALWPEPQYDDLDRLYLPKIGIDLVREVLLDDLHGAVDVVTQVEREPGKFRSDRERAASPLFVRAVPGGFDPASPIVRGISELLLACPSRLRWDAERLARQGIQARALISTSSRAWSLDWKGGDLPPELMLGGGEAVPIGRVPLAALFEGTFPPPSIDPALPTAAGHAGEPNGEQASSAGRLLVVGCSEMFRDGEISAPGRDNAQLLLNSAAWLALPADLAAILARRSAPPGLGLIAPTSRILWRVLVLGAGPATILVLGFWCVRRRAARAARPADRSGPEGS